MAQLLSGLCDHAWFLSGSPVSYFHHLTPGYDQTQIQIIFQTINRLWSDFQDQSDRFSDRTLTFVQTILRLWSDSNSDHFPDYRQTFLTKLTAYQTQPNFNYFTLTTPIVVANTKVLLHSWFQPTSCFQQKVKKFKIIISLTSSWNFSSTSSL